MFESSEDKPGEKFAVTASTIRNQCRALKKQEEELRTEFAECGRAVRHPKKPSAPNPSTRSYNISRTWCVRPTPAVAPAAGVGQPPPFHWRFYRHRRGNGPHCRFTGISCAIWFGHDHDCRGLGFQNKQAQQLQHLAATSQQHLEQVEERELEAAAKLRDEEAEILLSTRIERSRMLLKNTTRVQKLEAQLAESQALQTTGLINRNTRMPCRSAKSTGNKNWKH